MNPNVDDIYAGLSGFAPAVDRFELGDGILANMIENRHVPDKGQLKTNLFGDEAGMTKAVAGSNQITT